MKRTIRQEYKTGQKWEFATDVQEFQSYLIIGDSYKSDSSTGVQRGFYVYIPYSASGRLVIPEICEGQALAMTAADLDQNVTKLLESGVELPRWWKLGHPDGPPEKVPSSEGGITCATLIPDTLRMLLERRKRERSRFDAMHKLLDKLKKRKRSRRSRSVAESWQRIGAFLKEGDQGFRTNEGASLASIKRFEEMIGMNLPDDFRESLRIHDGGDWWMLPNYGEFLPLSEIERQWAMYKEWQTEGSYAADTDDWKVSEHSGPIKPVFWSVKRIPITDNSGDHLMLDLDPPRDGDYGQIIKHSHEVGPERVVARSWSEFLADLVEDLDTGKYTCNGSGDIRRVDDI